MSKSCLDCKIFPICKICENLQNFIKTYQEFLNIENILTSIKFYQCLAKACKMFEPYEKEIFEPYKKEEKIKILKGKYEKVLSSTEEFIKNKHEENQTSIKESVETNTKEE